MSESFEKSPSMEKIFSDAGIEPDVVDEGTGNDTTSATEVKGSDTTGSTAPTSEVKGAPGKDSVGDGTDGVKKPGKEKETKVTDNPGDLKLADGSVVKAGAERRHYETAQIARQQLNAAKGELNTANQKYSTLETKFNTLNETIGKIGLENPEQVSDAVKLYKDLARDPKGTVTKLLAELKAMGHTFDDIGGAVDTQLILSQLNQKKTSEEPKGPTKEDIDKQAATEVAAFVTAYPDAVTHEQHIAALIDRAREGGQMLSLSDAYFALKQRVVNDGYDWLKPLGPQLEARKAAAAAPNNPKPRTNGRVPTDNGTQKLDASKTVHPERELDSDSIVRAAMAEAGYQIRN